MWIKKEDKWWESSQPALVLCLNSQHWLGRDCCVDMHGQVSDSVIDSLRSLCAMFFFEAGAAATVSNSQIPFDNDGWLTRVELKIDAIVSTAHRVDAIRT